MIRVQSKRTLSLDTYFGKCYADTEKFWRMHKTGRVGTNVKLQNKFTRGYTDFNQQLELTDGTYKLHVGPRTKLGICETIKIEEGEVVEHTTGRWGDE